MKTLNAILCGLCLLFAQTLHAQSKMYWTDTGTDKIQRANLDGSSVEDLVTTGLIAPEAIALDVAAGKMYWTDSGTDKIRRANLDGTGIEDLVTTGLFAPAGIALDLAAGKMYWTDTGYQIIQRANLDGTAVEELLELSSPKGIALDLAAGKMYWTDLGTDMIQRANLDGTGVEDLVTTGLVGAGTIVLDLAAGKMYWTDGGTNKIQRANLDGTGIEDLVATGLSAPNGIALAAAGKMYWTDLGSDKIQRANLDGSSVEDLVTTGLSGPRGIALYLQPAADAGADETICAGQSVNIGGGPTASGGYGGPYTISWSPSTDLNDATAANPVASPTATTTYTVTVTETATNLSATDMVTVTVNPLPTVTFNSVGPFLVTEAPVDLAGSVSPSGGAFSGPGISGSMFDPSVAAVGVHTVTYSFTDGNSCTNSASQSIIVNPELIKPFVFLANKVTLKSTKQVPSHGDIHSNGVLTVEKGKPSTYNSNLTAVGKITINKENVINGDVTSQTSVSNSGTINGTKSVGPVNSEALPSLSYSAGGANKTVPNGGSLTLAPGSYGIVIINSSGTLKLSSGEYFMNELRASSSDPVIEVDLTSGDPVTINVVSNLQLDKDAAIQLLPNGESDSELVTFNTLQSAAVNFGKEAYLLGSFNAPNAIVTLVKNSQLRGSICAKEILVSNDCLFLHHDSPGSLPGPGNLPKSSSDEEEATSNQQLVTSYQLAQNYPNPFNPTTTISFALPEASEVGLSIFNMNGQLVKKLVAGEMNAGRHNFTWDARDERGLQVASGVYLYVIQAGNFTAQRKLVLMK